MAKKESRFAVVGEFAPIFDSIEDTGILTRPDEILPEGDNPGPQLIVTGERMGTYQNPAFETPPSHSAPWPSIQQACCINKSNEIEQAHIDEMAKWRGRR